MQTFSLRTLFGRWTTSLGSSARTKSKQPTGPFGGLTSSPFGDGGAGSAKAKSAAANTATAAKGAKG